MEKKVDFTKIKKESLNNDVDVDPLKYLYMVFSERDIITSDVMRFDLTELFEEYLADKIEKGEIIRILIRGEVRTGKSSVGLAIKEHVNELLYRLDRRKDVPDSFRTILADQTEFVRFMRNAERDPLKKEVCIQIDEYNTMAEGGANASTEQQILQSYGDMFAVNHVHVINCNPTQIRDPNAFVHLEVLGKKPEKGYTKCKVTYVNNLDGDSKDLGYIIVDVWKYIKNWVTYVRPVFEKIEKTEKDEEHIEEWRKKDWYTRYYIKKQLRLDLTSDHGIRDVRELEFADIVLLSYSDLKDLAICSSSKSDLPIDLMMQTLKEICEEQSVIFSFYTETIVLGHLKALLYLLMLQYKNLNKLESPKINDKKRKRYSLGYEVTKRKFKKALSKQIEKSNLYKRYLDIQ